MHPLIDQPRGEGDEEGVPLVVAPCGCHGSAHLLQEVAHGDEEGPQQATWHIIVVVSYQLKGA